MSRYKQQAIAIAAIIVAILHPQNAWTQVPVSLAPIPHIQFLSNAGIPLASGCVFTYQAGTSTPQATYTDSTGTSTNTNPIILNAGGFADIWLTSQNYKITVKSAGGVSCVSGAQLWSVDNVSGFLGLLSLSNIWTNAQTFSQPITDTATINQIVVGTAPNQTTLNFPAPAGNVSLTFPNTTDTMVGRATTDTLTNKTLTSAVLNTPNLNGTVITGFPATYFSMANDLVTGTTLNKLTKINPAGLAGFAILPLITDTGGIVGITVSGAGITGNATIQQNGSVSCVFDNATTAGNYIQISPTVVGDCHDAGISYPSTGQVIGRSLATNAGIGTNIIDLFGPEINFASFPKIVFNTASSINSSTLPLQTMVTPAVSATYRFGAYINLVAPGSACTGSTTVALNIVFTDPQAGGSTNWVLLLFSNLSGTPTIASPQNIAITGNGVQGAGPSVAQYLFRAKTATTIQYAVTYVAGANCAPGPTYQVWPVLEQLSAN